ncbi:antibiotic ABC transporter permease [Haladaptatus sp. DYSN1]|uniref:antibiotic ABC transporter permease n=1 Tax=unclassified Haladaptatus TaxID=2622732 RepID=UPI0024049482|nr:antibiotic ABC transporter permease [Haladaptatus sp. DYSN1]
MARSDERTVRPEELLAATLRYARARSYTGWDYADGMSSRLLAALPVENRWLNFVVQEGIKRAPINLRPLFLVERRQSFKGSALFALANRRASQLGLDDVDYDAEARGLADWLVANQRPGYHGFCGGHAHVLQELGGKRQPTEGDVVSTTYGVRSLLELAAFDPTYAQVAESAAAFLTTDLNYTETGDEAYVTYVAAEEATFHTLNAIALAGSCFVDLYAHTGDETYAEKATKLLAFVVARQQPIGGWYYRDPREASHLSMDGHHNGFIIECLQHYAAVVNADRFETALDVGLAFYRTRLFDPDGAPRWDERRAFPRDVHAAAQGILVFTRAGDLNFAGRILQWTVRNLYLGDGRFAFRCGRFYTRRVVLMRWAEAWMAYAIAEFAHARSKAALEPTSERAGSP